MLKSLRHLAAAIARYFIFLAPAAPASAAVNAADTLNKPANATAIVMFFVFVAATLAVTYWAAKRTHTTSDFYTAGGGISAFQNGLAIAGDGISASAFLGLTAMIYSNGLDGMIYAVSFLIGWPVVILLMAERLRNLGKFTFADVISYRLEERPLRILAASGTLVVVLFYLTAQMVGAGQLIKLLFGIDYISAEVIVGALIIVYVMFGGMLATTWVQIIKACLLLGGASIMALLVLAHFDFNPVALLTEAVSVNPKHQAIMAPGSLFADPIDAISLAIALMFGTAGLPHILMRFFTVANAKEARRSVFYAISVISYASILIFIIGFGAITFVSGNPSYIDPTTNGLIGGANMPAIWLADAVGGGLLRGFISAVAFATILAVVAGLTLAGASAVSHDIYASILCRGQADEKAEMRVTRFTTAILGVLAIALGIAFQSQNVAFMVALATAVAASANFPVLLLSVSWSRLTTRGATIGGFAGLLTAIALTLLSPAIWQTLLGHPEAIFPYSSPALFSVPIGFLCCWLFSVTDSSPRAAIDLAGFEAQYIRSQTGIGMTAG